MNLQQLFKEIYGEDSTPTGEDLKQLGDLMTALPDNIFNAVFQCYALGKPIDAVAKETGHNRWLVERWVKSGLSLLKVFASVEEGKGQRS